MTVEPHGLIDAFMFEFLFPYTTLNLYERAAGIDQVGHCLNVKEARLSDAFNSLPVPIYSLAT